METIIAQCVDSQQGSSVRVQSFNDLRQRIEKSPIQFDSKQIKRMFGPLMVGVRRCAIR